MKLKAERVGEIVRGCLFTDEEVAEVAPEQPECVKVEGIMATLGFHPGRLQEHKDEIVELLDELPDEFKEGTGGGMSFLNACMDKHGNHWAEHPSMDNLFMLGIGIRRVMYCMPRDMWKVFPGGMPYIVIAKADIEKEAAAQI